MLSFSEKDKKIIGVITILSGVLALACIIVGIIASKYDFEALSNPLKLLDLAPINTGLIRLFMLLDVFGYYLLLLPIVFLLHSKMVEKTPWAGLLTSLGYGYILIGAIGASVLAVLWPAIITNHELAVESMKSIYKSQFVFSNDFVVKGMWNYLEVFLSGFWWLGIGLLVIESIALKYTTLLLGVSCIIDGIGELLQLPIVAETGLNIYLVLAIVWPIWIGIVILKNKF